MLFEHAFQPLLSLAGKEVLIDEHAGQEAEAGAHRGDGVAAGNHQVAHQGRAGAGAADHAAAIEHGSQSLLRFRAEIGRGRRAIDRRR